MEMKTNPNYLYNCETSQVTTPAKLDGFLGKIGFSLLAIVSLVMCWVITSTIVFNEKLMNIHPATLLALIGATEFSTCWYLLLYYNGVVKFTCYFGMVEKL